MELLKVEIHKNYGRFWVTGLCRAHFANHAGCGAKRLKRLIERAGYNARASNGCIDTDAPYQLLGELAKKL